MSAPRTTDIHALAGAYALDAVTDIERAAFARHVRECESCAVEVAELRETASRLAAVAWQAPPAHMRAEVLAEVANTRQLGAGRPAEVGGSAGAVRVWRRRAALALVAGVIAVAGVATTVVVEENRLGDERRVAQQAAAEQARVNAVLTATDVAVHSAEVPGGGRMTVVASPSQNAGVVVMADLPAPPTGRVYQLWLLREGTAPAPAPAMAPGQRAGMAMVSALGAAQQIGVTLEPVGGSLTPSMAPIATVPIV
jgi:anti-sigma-K factor RskA